MRRSTLPIAGIAVFFVVVAALWGWCLRWNPAYITAWGTFITGIATVLLAGGAIYTGFMAVREFGEKTDIERSRWTNELFKQWFIDQTYKDVRRKIDFDLLDDIRALIKRDLKSTASGKKANFTPDEMTILDAFTDYLNFFEYVGELKKLKRIGDEEIRALFDYYLCRLVEVDADSSIRTYLQKGYEELTRLLNGLSPYLFVYGTLMRDGSRHGLLTSEKCDFVADGTIRASLYSVPMQDYPAAILSNFDGRVAGELYRLPTKYDALEELDREEGVSEGLFARVLVVVDIGNGRTEKAWLYAYRGRVDEEQRIKSGRFTHHQ